MVVPARDAATVMLVRDAIGRAGGSTIEVCMLRRNLASEFVAGAYVFPGGSVDPEDRSPEALALCEGRDDVEASGLLGVQSGGLAFWFAALRECFEEAGVLVARRRATHGSSVGMLEEIDPAGASRLAAYRLDLNAGRIGMVEICRREGLVLAADTVHYVSHWITPEVSPRRFDTRFFVTAAPHGQVVRHDEGETIASQWVRPHDALARYSAGEIELLPPTVENFRALVEFESTDEVISWARTVTAVPTVLPVVEFTDGGLHIFRPGDDGYEDAAARAASAPTSTTWPPADFDGLTRPTGTDSVAGGD